jgi:hypothetical protein
MFVNTKQLIQNVSNFLMTDNSDMKEEFVAGARAMVTK